MKTRLSIRIVTIMMVFMTLVFAGVFTLLGLYIISRMGYNTPGDDAHPPFLILLFCASSVIGTLISVPLTRYFVIPIKDIAKAMDKVKEGDFEVRIDETQTSAELGVLVRGFNGMVEELGSIELFRKDFISNFSHEFKTPITSIRGFAKELLADDTLSEGQKREYLQIIFDESERLSNMASNVLLLTNLEHTTKLSGGKWFSLDEQIRRCLLLLERRWMEKELELDLELDEIYCEGDEEMLSHIWVNLLSNGIKFSPRGGVLSVRCYKADGDICVSVSDRGQGIPQDKIEKIFDRFYQADTSHQSDGNGLGLALCKRIAELAEGSISVKSELGKGSTFTVSLKDKAITHTESK